MTIEFTCPNAACGKRLRGPDELAGKKVSCPGCGVPVDVPSPTPPTQAPAQESAPAGATAAKPAPGPPAATRDEGSLEADPFTGRTLGNFEIMEKLGEGGVGQVYKARNVQLNRVVAIKLLRTKAEAADSAARERFLAEARSAAQLDHPNVVTIYSVSQAGNHILIEMQYVEGTTLRGIIDAGEPNVRGATGIIRDAAKGLAAAHEKSIVHRDIKPENIMVDRKGRVMVTDFGLARWEEGSTRLTLDGKVMGTPHYMSPEQTEGRATDFRSDIYSLGATFFHTVTGDTPFHGETLLAIMRQHSDAPVPEPNMVNPNVPAAISQIIKKMLAKDPANRYQSCEELIADLHAGTIRRAVPAKKSRRLMVWVASVAFVLIAVVLGVVITLRLLSPPQEPQPALATSAAQQPVHASAAKPPATPQPVELPPGGFDELLKAKKPKPPAKDEPEAATPDTKKPGEKPESEPEKPALAEPEKPTEVKFEAPAFDLAAYAEAVKPVNRLIDEFGYERALLKAKVLAPKFGDPMKFKIANIERLEAMRATAIERINSGKAKLTMKDVAKRWGYVGAIEKAGIKEISAMKGKFNKRWDEFEKTEIRELYLRALPAAVSTPDAKTINAQLAVAIFLLEGTPRKECLEKAEEDLVAAADQGEDVSPYLALLEELRQSLASAKPTAQTAIPKEAIPAYPDEKPGTITYKGKRITVPAGMVFVPPGRFVRGQFGGGEHAAGSGYLRQEVYLDAYFIDKYEVTNTQYKKFVESTRHRIPMHWAQAGGTYPQGKENHPVTYVSWEDAAAYAKWGGKRLPTEAEWEKAASWEVKPERQRSYPWGDEFDSGAANDCYQHGCPYVDYDDYKEHSTWWHAWERSEEGEKIIARGGATSPVGEFKRDVSPFGCFDMAGNVREWCADWYDPNYYRMAPYRNPTGPVTGEHRVYRGGAWYSRRSEMDCPDRSHSSPTAVSSSYGFRCATDVPELRSEAPEPAAERPKPNPDLKPIPAYRTEKPTSVRYRGKKVAIPAGMVLVPAGKFLMGNKSEGSSYGHIQREVEIDAYLIDKYEVTNRQYQQFLDATGYPYIPDHWRRSGGRVPKGKEDHPVGNITWDDAAAYAAWAGKRLPTEAEWEKAAGWDERTKQQWRYPWGDRFDPSLINCWEQLGVKKEEGVEMQVWWRDWSVSREGERIIFDGGNTAAVGQFRGDVSPWGCFDMGGNVSEFCADWYDPDYYKTGPNKDPEGPDEGEYRVLRGGTWMDSEQPCRTYYRRYGYPTTPYSSLGFRCAKTVE